MKRGSIVFLIMVAVFALGACSQGSENTDNSSNNEQNEPEAEQPGNKENVEAVAKSLSNENTRYKLIIDDEADIFVILEDYNVDGDTYGFDDPKTGVSIYAHASEKGLNHEQAWGVSGLVNPSDEDLKEIMEKYPDDFRDGKYPYKGADFDYTTVSNVEAEDAEEGIEMTAEVDVHFHLKDGTEEVETVETSNVPDNGDTELDEGDVEDALNADIMNEDIPSDDRSVYVEDD